MKKRFFCVLKVLSVIAVLVMASLYIGIPQTIYAKQVASMPDAWLEIKPGMTSGEAREILGEPQADGRNLKSLDRWFYEENGVEMHLDLWMEGRNMDDQAIVFRVSRWKRYFGAEVDRVDSPSW